MSSVFLVRCVQTRALLAAKVLRHDLAGKTDQQDRFVREARAIARTGHENIVAIYDSGRTYDGTLYLIMEYVPGEPLYRVIAKGPLSAAFATDVARQITSALQKIHEAGVVHRDLKPDNVLLISRPGRTTLVKVVDFGIAKILDAPPLTASQHIFGTPGYIAPEYIQSVHIDGRADFYSLGVILYEMVTGSLPYEYEYPADLLAKHLKEKPKPPSHKVPHLDRGLESVIMRCLEKDPTQRYQNAASLLSDLERVQAAVGPAPLHPLPPRRVSARTPQPTASRPASHVKSNSRPWIVQEPLKTTPLWMFGNQEEEFNSEVPTLAYVRPEAPLNHRQPRTLKRY